MQLSKRNSGFDPDASLATLLMRSIYYKLIGKKSLLLQDECKKMNVMFKTDTNVKTTKFGNTSSGYL